MVAEVLLWLLAAASPDAGAPSSFQEIQGSHIDANVPESADFERFLRRDLAEYFSATRKAKKVTVEYELLRRGPTQSGVSYPIEVTDFLSEAAIRNDPNGIYRVFPMLVCETIKAKVAQ